MQAGAPTRDVRRRRRASARSAARLACRTAPAIRAELSSSPARSPRTLIDGGDWLMGGRNWSSRMVFQIYCASSKGALAAMAAWRATANLPRVYCTSASQQLFGPRACWTIRRAPRKAIRPWRNAPRRCRSCRGPGPRPLSDLDFGQGIEVHRQVGMIGSPELLDEAAGREPQR